jgi:hypothetical protein
MRRMVRWLVMVSFALTVLPAAGFADDEKAGVYDCGEPKCGEWKPKGANTCRTCETVQCRKQGDEELLAGSKKRNECYEGHGAPPTDAEQDE